MAEKYVYVRMKIGEVTVEADSAGVDSQGVLTLYKKRGDNSDKVAAFAAGEWIYWEWSATAGRG